LFDDDKISKVPGVFEIHPLRIAKFAHGVRQFIAAFNDGIYSVQELKNSAK